MMKKLTWWMRIVGLVYLLMFLMAAILRIPIQQMGPPGVLEQAASGDAVPRLLVDTWVILGLEFGIVGVLLIYFSRIPEQSAILVRAVIAVELVRGIGADLYFISRGYQMAPQLIWIIIHLVIIITGIFFLRIKEK